MDAFYSFWSAPNRIRNKGQIQFPDYEMLTAILSALKWQEHSGRVRMVTDTPGAEFFRSHHMDGIWNELDTSLDGIDLEVDPLLFWAAGKLYALKGVELPAVMLDTDLIVWRKPEIPGDCDVCAAHLEALNPAVYPDHSIFHLKDGYQFPGDWDFTLPACNTAFLYLKNPEFRDSYTAEAIRFFHHIDLQGLNPVTAMCFAEQRFLSMCAMAEHQKLTTLFHPSELMTQTLLTHTWGMKTLLSQPGEARTQFCMRCVKRIMEDYPERSDLLSENPALRGYYEAYQIHREKTVSFYRSSDLNL